MTTNESDDELALTDAMLDIIGKGDLDDLDLNSGNVDPVLRDLIQLRRDVRD